MYYDSVKNTGSYYYALSMVDTGGKLTGRSTADYGYLGTLGTPTSCTASNSYATYILISWDTVSYASGYYIYKSASSTGVFQLIDSTTGKSYTDRKFTIDTGSIGDKYCFYKIQAYSASKKAGNQSSVVTGILKGFSAPSNVRATTKTYKSKIVLTWDSVPSATGYTIYRSMSSSGDFTKLGTVTAPTYTDSGLSAAIPVSFYYTVSSLKGTGESSQSTPVAGTLLFAPSMFSIAADTMNLTVSWSSNGDPATKGFILFRSSDIVNFSNFVTTTATKYIDKVSNGGYYRYAVKEFSAFDTSVFSNFAGSQLKPRIVGNLKGQSVRKINTLSWSAVPYVQYYRIYKGTQPTSLSFLATMDSTKTSYSDSATLTSNTPYYYSVTGYNQGGEGGKCSVIGISPSTLLPDVPTQVEAAMGPGYIWLRWGGNLIGTTGYYIYRAKSATETFTKLFQTPDMSFRDSTATANTIYYYKVSAYNSAGESALSDYASGMAGH